HITLNFLMHFLSQIFFSPFKKGLEKTQVETFFLMLRHQFYFFFFYTITEYNFDQPFIQHSIALLPNCIIIMSNTIQGLFNYSRS
ncbi:hypothetical protein ACJX0J_013350, partial [Zea mays]